MITEDDLTVLIATTIDSWMVKNGAMISGNVVGADRKVVTRDIAAEIVSSIRVAFTTPALSQ